jgi:hypothetical protein
MAQNMPFGTFLRSFRDFFAQTGKSDRAFPGVRGKIARLFRQ